jgi:two-component system response regulator AtoC
MKKSTILIVDDEKNTREGLARALRRQYDVFLAEDGQTALQIVERETIDVMLSDVRMPGMDGIALLKRVMARTPQPICMLLTAYGTVEQAVNAMKLGAYDFLIKPVNLDRLEMLLERALSTREMAEENRQLHEQLDHKFGLENIIGNSRAMQPVFDAIRQVAPSRASVLINGETGTGKELVAHAIHRLSPREKAPLIAVNCSALAGSLLESELFGHETGAFTDAKGRRKGRFELADGGTLFLDEIGEIDPTVQVKLLRVLEERSFERVGGEKTIEVDVRIVAATNKNLKQLVADGTFREDLYYRLNVVTIELPPLRERGQDISLLTHHFIGQLSEENAREIHSITPEAMEALSKYEWPGNIRELRNMMERMVVMARGDRLTLRDVPAEIRSDSENGGGRLNTEEQSLEAVEKQMIAQALKANNGNRTRAAEQLGISRRTLHRKLNEFGLREA